MQTNTSTKHHCCFLVCGETNTDATIALAAEYAAQNGIKKVLVASCSGNTALLARKVFPLTVEIIAVTHVQGFARPNHQELSEDMRKGLIEKGVSVLTAQHAFGGVGRGLRRKLDTYQVDEIMAFTLRMFGQGTKVAIEIALMAADAGLVRVNEDIIAIGGTMTGADTALLIQPANSANCLDLKVREVICKPRDF